MEIILFGRGDQLQRMMMIKLTMIHSDQYSKQEAIIIKAKTEQKWSSTYQKYNMLVLILIRLVLEKKKPTYILSCRPIMSATKYIEHMRSILNHPILVTTTNCHKQFEFLKVLFCDFNWFWRVLEIIYEYDVS